MSESVTITLNADLVRKLEVLKTDENTSYADVITLIIESFFEETLTEEELTSLDTALTEAKTGKVHTLSEIKKELGML